MALEPAIYMVGGANQSGLRNHNERLILSLVRDAGPIAARDLAHRTALSAQTVSVILRGLESEGLLVRGEPVRGKVGKPSVPLTLTSGATWSIGLKVGRRSADLAIMDLKGVIADQIRLTYPFPLPDQIFEFVEEGLRQFRKGRSGMHFVGLGLAAPYEIWKWHELVGAPRDELAVWRAIDMRERLEDISGLPVIVMNDATAACRAEHHFGGHKHLRDYLYVFVGALIGGGVVLNRSVMEGNLGNAGAIGPLTAIGEDGQPAPLLDVASLHLLETSVGQRGADPAKLWARPLDWASFEDDVGPWVERAGAAIAQAAVSACAIIDFEAVIIDGAFPPSVRHRLVNRTRNGLDHLDTRGLVRPQIQEGSAGENARVIGASYAPISAQFFLDSPSILSGAAQ